MLHRAVLTVVASCALAAALLGCSSAGRWLREVLREHPPAPLDSMRVASDARVDSLGYILGSFVGEGTGRAVHLLSSDTGFIAALARRYRPWLVQSNNLWLTLGRERAVSLAPGGPRRTTTGAPLFDRAVAGGPAGHTSVTPTAVVLRGSYCGVRGAQAEIIVEDSHRAQEPPLLGPVLGSLTRSESNPRAEGDRSFRMRQPVPQPGEDLRDELLSRTTRVMDSTLGVVLPSLKLRPPLDDLAPEVNTLTDVGGADLIAYQSGSSSIRFAVSLRLRRISVHRDTVVAATVMAWDSAGAWQQFIFQPTVLSLRQGRLGPYGAVRRSLFWRRLQPISELAFQRDNLWMEQVNVRDGSVLWGIIQPRGNIVVAAAEVAGPCS
jgi:hypothetical protein